MLPLRKNILNFKIKKYIFLQVQVENEDEKEDQIVSNVVTLVKELNGLSLR